MIFRTIGLRLLAVIGLVALLVGTPAVASAHPSAPPPRLKPPQPPTATAPAS